MRDDKLPLRSRALRFLRDLRDWTQQELAAAAEVSLPMVKAWEQGTRVPSPQKLAELAQTMGHPEATLRDVLRLLSPRAVLTGRWIGPVHFSAERELDLEDFFEQSGRLVAFLLRQGIDRAEFQRTVNRDRKEARALRSSLVAEPALRMAVRQKREYQTWAVAELLCEESIRAAAHDPQRALELAEAAVVVSELIPGEERWRLRVQGYAHMHVGNAWRVIGNKPKAIAAFGSKTLWEFGKEGDPARLLNEARVCGLEASLLREEGRLEEALERLDKGLAVCSSSEKAYLLISRAKVLRSAERYTAAFEALQEADAYIGAGGHRLQFAQRFELAANLCELKRFSEAWRLVPEVTGLAFQLGKKLDMLRVKWLEGRIFAGIGRIAEAAEVLSIVRVEFEAKELFYEATLVAIDLAAVLLKLERTTQLKLLTRKMANFMNGKGLDVNILQEFHAFRKAVEEEVATVEFAESVRRHLLRVWESPG